MDEGQIEQMVQLLKKQQEEYGAASSGKKKLTDEELRQSVLKTSGTMGPSFLTGLDESIIGTAFAQIVMEGRLDPNLKYYVTRALQREMLPIVTRNYGDASQQQAYNDKMKKLLYVVDQMK